VLVYVARRIVYVIPIVLSVALGVLSPCAHHAWRSAGCGAAADACRNGGAIARGLRLDRPLPVQFGLWLWRALTRSRPFDRDRAAGADGSIRAVGTP